MFENSKKTKIIVLIIIFMIVLWIIYLIFYPPIAFKVYIDWWKSMDPKGEYNCLDLKSLAYWSESKWLYDIRQGMISGDKELNQDWIYFLTGLIFSNSKGLIKGGTTTPRSICRTIVPEQIPQNLLNWPDHKGSKEDDSSWVYLISNWGQITWSKDKTTGKTVYTVGSHDDWKNHPDNFLYQDYAIAADSPLVIAYVTGWTTDELGTQLYPEFLNALLGSSDGKQSGGWLGFLQAGSSFEGMGLAKIRQIVWSDDVQALARYQEAPGRIGESTTAKVMKWGGFLMGIANTAMMAFSVFG